MAGTRSVPRSMHRIVIVPSGRGTSARMKIRNGEISGMLLVNVYAIDFFRLSKIRRPTECREHYHHYSCSFYSSLRIFLLFSETVYTTAVIDASVIYVR